MEDLENSIDEKHGFINKNTVVDEIEILEIQLVITLEEYYSYLKLFKGR